MLTHALEFVQKRGVLARHAESAMESSHHTFNRLLSLSHSNLGEDLPERLRRCVANAAIAELQPLLLDGTLAAI